MELKRYSRNRCNNYLDLLIVPYGIETRAEGRTGIVGSWLLIVPYGIETLQAFYLFLPHALLIVPYGIETKINVL